MTTSLGFEDVDSLLSRPSFDVDLLVIDPVSELEPTPESEVVDSIMMSLLCSELLLLTS